MKKQTIVSVSIAGILILIGLIAFSKSTDVIYVATGIAFFAICIAYAEWCERL